MLEIVQPTDPIAAYIGGKRLLSKHIVARINQIPHKRYCEPFMGMGGVFLRRTKKPPVEVVNDINQDVINLFRVVQRHFNALLEMCEWSVSSRDEFYRLRNIPREYLTDIERAYCFLYLQKHSFGGKTNYGGMKSDRNSFNRNILVKKIRSLHERLSGVFLDCLPYEECIKRQDKPGTLFYLDPPYFGTEDYYQDFFSKNDFHKLASLLKTIKGHFILSINNIPETRELFNTFQLEVVNIKYSCNAKTTKMSEELIVTNYES
ncbi:DNA-adenine methylase (Dam) (PDB:4GOL) [Commensalibacter communis]|uniref:site-specific DNA-methyltransferase (adenine-specific) n=1 Tax=Commensalibacter communis TaxID=2972786 RepID=A0A9W4XIU6_9PROT|nr:DNA adenine methylase [Commensalibacter communis]CAI3958460.1 DNA-adenine methylase (Dam) (PDB:4GOL) [Commensalibacter communis]CAI3960519.1 DNA-adenine methylase (Dam) (PDB:4GOL) [Commensalibacter communis]CAI3960643.1 DNA-adenine methylase (Dam) (PDB:4GOL) [Commensalibacter communis]CAI3960650.1 DNA-adenine methylase (Dam) (PDB:4GOL) [Commensalibacter communis]